MTAALCRRYRHELVPENLGDDGRCLPCKREYAQARRQGATWDGPVVGRVACVANPRPLDPARLRRDRIAVGACPDCGWTPDAGPHRPQVCPSAAALISNGAE